MVKKKFGTIDTSDFEVPQASNIAIADKIIKDSSREHADIPLDRLIPNPRQPRKYFDEEKIRELAADIEQNGLIEEIVVRRSPTQNGVFEIICGERRTRACRLLEHTTISAQIRKCSDAELLRIALAENEQHQQLTPYERALAYEELRQELGGEEETSVRKLAETVKKNKDHVQLHLNLLRAQPELIQWIVADPDVPVRIIDELRKVDDDASRAELIEDVRKKRFNQDDIIEIVRDFRKLRNQEAQKRVQQNSSSMLVEQEITPSIQEPSAPSSPSPSDEAIAAALSPISSSIGSSVETAMTNSSPALRLAKLRKVLAKDDKQIQAVVMKHHKDALSMTEEELALVRSYAQRWMSEIERLFE
jgi:ParB family chromosome partitioning protein